ncbi:hypothetical protein AVEN_174403-1 [Araneus ventricosus]|uniref:Uncharacterized protein n=1 Tax=Araneus ventricosus TaxID=182803 RepID=A0A4Y2H3S9_ARAVE|nr:hypothetical protein AVEN_174403-1 [Araneus ventricosus]
MSFFCVDDNCPKGAPFLNFDKASLKCFDDKFGGTALNQDGGVVCKEAIDHLILFGKVSCVNCVKEWTENTSLRRALMFPESESVLFNLTLKVPSWRKRMMISIK